MGIKGLYYRCDECRNLALDVYEVNIVDNVGGKFEYYLCDNCLSDKLKEQKVRA